MIETPVQIAIREWSAANWEEQQAARARCKPGFERLQCENAYSKRFHLIADQIAQRHGLNPTPFHVDWLQESSLQRTKREWNQG